MATGTLARQLDEKKKKKTPPAAQVSKQREHNDLTMEAKRVVRGAYIMYINIYAHTYACICVCVCVWHLNDKIQCQKGNIMRYACLYANHTCATNAWERSDYREDSLINNHST